MSTPPVHAPTASLERPPFERRALAAPCARAFSGEPRARLNSMPSTRASGGVAPTMNVPFVIDSTLTTDDSSLAGTVGMVIVYRKEQEDRQKVKAQVYSLDGDTLNVAVAAVAAIAHVERAPPLEEGSAAETIVKRLTAKEPSPKKPIGNPYSGLAVEDEETEPAPPPTA